LAPRSGLAKQFAERIRADEQSNLPMQDRLSILDHFDQAQSFKFLERIAVPVVSVRNSFAHSEKRTSRGFLLCDRSTQDVPVIAIQPWEHYLLGLCSFHLMRIL